MCKNVLRVKLISVNSRFAVNYHDLLLKFGLTKANWYTSLDHLLDKVIKKIAFYIHNQYYVDSLRSFVLYVTTHHL